MQSYELFPGSCGHCVIMVRPLWLSAGSELPVSFLLPVLPSYQLGSLSTFNVHTMLPGFTDSSLVSISVKPATLQSMITLNSVPLGARVPGNQ